MKCVYEITDGDEKYCYVARSEDEARKLHSWLYGDDYNEPIQVRIKEDSEVLWFPDKIEEDEDGEYEGTTIELALLEWEQEHGPTFVGLLCTTEYM